MASVTAATVGVVLFHLRNPFFTDLLDAIEARAAAAGLRIRVADSDHDPQREASAVDRLVEEGADGILLAPSESRGPHMARLVERGTPFVLVGTVPTEPGVRGVAVDGEQGGFLAAQHLLAEGRRRLLFVTGPLGAEFRDRLAGARRAVGEVDGARLHVLAAPEFTVAAGAAAGQRILALGRRPDAVLAANDLLAIGLLAALTEHGAARVPQDVAVSGYDDLDLAATASVPLTSVRQPRREIGRIAVELLLDAMRGEPVGPATMLQPELVVRASTTARPDETAGPGARAG